MDRDLSPAGGERQLVLGRHGRLAAQAHDHVLVEGVLDGGEGPVVDRAGEVEAHDDGAQRAGLASDVELNGGGHGTCLLVRPDRSDTICKCPVLPR